MISGIFGVKCGFQCFPNFTFSTLPIRMLLWTVPNQFWTKWGLTFTSKVDFKFIHRVMRSHNSHMHHPTFDCYREKRHKIILEANDDMVKYRPKVTYTFRPDMSRGSQDDKVTLLNVPYVVGSFKFQNLFLDQSSFSKYCDIFHAKPFIRQSLK